MDKSTQVLLGMAVLAMVASALFAVYRWRQRERVRQVTAWVGEFLSSRDGNRPQGLTVNCSDDANWPILVGYDDPHNGKRHTAQFACGGRRSSLALISEQL
jgi:hypothetical protein